MHHTNAVSCFKRAHGDVSRLGAIAPLLGVIVVLALAPGCVQRRYSSPMGTTSFEEQCEQRAAMGEEPPECLEALAKTTARRRAAGAKAEQRRKEAMEMEAKIKAFEATRPRAGCLLRLRNKYNECMSAVTFLRIGNNPLLYQRARAMEAECTRTFQVDAIVCNGLPETAVPDGRDATTGDDSETGKINGNDK